MIKRAGDSAAKLARQAKSSRAAAPNVRYRATIRLNDLNICLAGHTGCIDERTCAPTCSSWLSCHLELVKWKGQKIEHSRISKDDEGAMKLN